MSTHWSACQYLAAVSRLDLLSNVDFILTLCQLLSGILDRLSPPATTLSWSLTPSPTPCYVELSRALTPFEILTAQKEANEYIARSTPVQVEMNLVGSEGGMPGSVPGNYKGDEGDERKGVLRTVEIVGLGDKNP